MHLDNMVLTIKQCADSVQLFTENTLNGDPGVVELTNMYLAFFAAYKHSFLEVGWNAVLIQDTLQIREFEVTQQYGWMACGKNGWHRYEDRSRYTVLDLHGDLSISVCHMHATDFHEA